MRTAEHLIGLEPVLREYLDDLEVLMSDNAGLKFTVTPATVTPAPTAAAWTRSVRIELQDSDGVLQEWFTSDITSGNSIADTSNAGTASIVSTTLSFERGVATVVVSGDAEAWLNTETDTLTIAAATIFGYTVAEKTSVETFTTA